MFKIKFILISLLFLAAVKVSAQEADSRSIRPGQKFTVDSIFIKGNHITKRYIILREMEVKQGNALTWKTLVHRLKESRQNLLNHSLFNFVNIKPVVTDSSKVNIYVSVVERWYIWPIPIIKYTDLNFNLWWEKKEIKHIDYGFNIKVNNFRGRMETLVILLQNGYNKSAELTWKNPYINNKETWGIGFTVGSSINHEVDYKNVNDKLTFFGESGNYIKKKFFFDLIATYRPGYKTLNTFYLSYQHYSFADTLLALNPKFAYGKPVFSFFSLEYDFKLDHRDYAAYPLHGYYVDVDLTQYGLGLLGSGVNFFSGYALYNQYFSIHKPWYFAYGVTLSAQPNWYRPYFLEHGLGYPPTTLRGYQLYVISGRWMALFHSNLKFELIPKKVVQIPFIRSEKFGKLFYSAYANLIFDAGYISDPQTYAQNPLANKFLYGTGLGIDFVTYYDTVVGFEYTLNRKNEKNFFISLVAPIK